MKTTHYLPVVAGLAALFAIWAQPAAVWAQTGDEAAPAVPAEELPGGSEILTSGPVHEAFAKPVTIQHEAGIEVPQPPPPNMQETPPSEKPVGAAMVWVPGYWAWAAERNDFIWVSGCWRSAPPQMHWVPGYWRAVAGHYEWVSGFWTPHTAASPQIEYLPAPPAPLEIEPPGQPPAPDQFWVPGCWYWSQEQWVHRHGYWHAHNAGWVWVPSHYAWTPRGYVFCPGYWDHDLDNRGVLFSPVYFPAAARGRMDFVFTPNLCVDLGVFRLNLFTYPRYHHYFFGDYYDDACLSLGIYPWFDCQTEHSWYDPLFVYDAWHSGRSDPHWLESQRHQYDMLRADRTLRPARTYTEFQARAAHGPEAQRHGPQLVAPVRAYAASQSTTAKFERMTTKERKQITVQTAAAHSFREQRARWEAPEVKPAAGEHHPVAASPVHEVVSPAAEHPTTHAKAVTRPAMAPPREVRITKPEQVKIPAPPIVAKPAESRYIQKEPPAHPAQEYSHLPSTPAQGHAAPSHDWQHKP